jgi:hypothetical protein
MFFQARTVALVAAASLAACGGGGGTVSAAGALPAAQSSWIAGLRYEPTDIRTSLSAPLPPYMYVDSGSTNGAYPSPATFAAQIESANPGLLSGACSSIAHLTATVVQFTDAHGVQAPSYVVFFFPKAVGTCVQSINLGAAGSNSFTLTVTP